MPKGDNGENSDVDDDGNKSEDGNGDAAGKKAGDKSKGGKGKGSDEGGEDDDDDKSGQVVFKSQADVDKMIQKRIDRATKDAADKAKMSETERMEKERDDALSQVRERDLKDEFVLQSGIDQAKATRIFRMYRDEIEVDDKGKATNLKDVLKSAKADFPELFTKLKGGGDGGKGSGDDGKAVDGDMNAAIRKMAGRT